MKPRNYPVVIHKDPDSDYGVTVPDLPGCFSAGQSIDEALEMTQEAIELHVEGLIEHGERVPRPGTIQKHQRNREFSGGIWAIVSVDLSHVPTRAPRTTRRTRQRPTVTLSRRR